MPLIILGFVYLKRKLTDKMADKVQFHNYRYPFANERKSDSFVNILQPKLKTRWNIKKSDAGLSVYLDAFDYKDPDALVKDLQTISDALNEAIKVT